MLKGKGARRRAATLVGRLLYLLALSALATAVVGIGSALVTMGKSDIPAGIIIILIGIYLFGLCVGATRGGSR